MFADGFWVCGCGGGVCGDDVMFTRVFGVSVCEFVSGFYKYYEFCWSV